MRILKYLKKGCIVYPLEGSSKEEVIRQLAHSAASCLGNISEEEVFRVIQEREDLGTTAIGGGIAIPHARVEGLENIVFIVGVSPTGVPFEALDGEPVHVIFMLLAPEDATTDYLRVLAMTSRLLKDKEMVKELSKAKGPSEILEIIEHAENRSYGAVV